MSNYFNFLHFKEVEVSTGLIKSFSCKPIDRISSWIAKKSYSTFPFLQIIIIGSIFFFFFGVFTNTYAWFVKGVKSNTFSQNSHILCLRLCSHVFIQCKSVSGMITWVGVLKKMLQIFLIQNKILFHYMNFPKFCSKQDKMCACGSLTL